MKEKVLLNGQLIDKANTKVSLSWNSPKPQWAKYAFRIIAVITTVLLFVVVSDPALTEDFKIRAGIYLKAIDMLALGLSNAMGIVIKDEANGSDSK